MLMLVGPGVETGEARVKGQSFRLGCVLSGHVNVADTERGCCWQVFRTGTIQDDGDVYGCFTLALMT